ncbi:MAG TPA: helix-turn-helix domain-containing protein [Pseudonocardiaceae bacterium]|jgi:DNA-binding HxlR family transcriptional regulator
MSGARTKQVADLRETDSVCPFGTADTVYADTPASLFGAADSFNGLTGGSPVAAIMAELDAVSSRGYGQFCGLVRAVEVVGERWAPLIIRDLLVSPKTVVELQAGNPRIPADLLVTRLRELERAGVVRRGSLDGVVRYEMTEYGAELDDIILSFGRWGARMLDRPRPQEILTTDSLIMSMRATFRSAAAAGLRVTYQLAVGPTVVGLRICDGVLSAGAGPLPGADLAFEPGPMLKGLLTGDVDPVTAVEDGSVLCHGDPALLGLFVQLFQLRAPAQAA